MKKLLVPFLLALFPSISFGLGTQLEFSQLQVQLNGTPYTGLGQKTRELRRLDEELTFIEYTLGGKPRRLWDDDGLGVLFLYQRDISGRYFDNEIELNSKLPMPKEPLVYALDKLIAEYKAMEAEYKLKKGAGGEKALQKVTKILEKIQKVKNYVASDRFREVSDIQASGLEDLVNDLDSNHTYAVEVGEDQVKRNKLSELIAVGVPATIGEEDAMRCRDTIRIDWKKATAKFFSNSKKKSSQEVESAITGDQRSAD